MKIPLTKALKTTTILITILLTTLTCHPPQPPTYDLIIYGPTSAGVMAAVQAKRMG